MNVDLSDQMKELFLQYTFEKITPELLEALRQDVLRGVFEYLDKHSECLFDTNTGGVAVKLPPLPECFTLKAEFAEISN